MQIKEVAGLLDGTITSKIIALASVKQRLQQAATDLRQEMATEVVLAIEELDGAASTCFEHALHLAATLSNSVSKKRRKDAVKKAWDSTSELVGMLNEDFSIPRSPLQSYMKREGSRHFNYKQHFDQPNWD